MKNLEELPRLRDSISYLYLEHVVIQQDSFSIVAIDDQGKTPIPIASITCLLLGPGVKITHAAIRAICENGCMAVWCGENMGRFYAAGIGETRSAKNLLDQAKVCMDEELHMEAVRRMYKLRFPNIPTEGLTLQQIRGMEGMRVKKAYELMARTHGIPWKKRNYKSEDWDAADPVNQALSHANTLLYGVCHASIVTLGYSPGLGFVHTGKQLSFVYDIADLYKTETTLPAAFEAAKRGGDVLKHVRSLCRQYFSGVKLLERIPKDIAYILQVEKCAGSDNAKNVGQLWDSTSENSEGGKNYGKQRGKNA